jgi:hypothetical protein
MSVVRVHLHVNKKFCGRSIWHAGVQSDSDNLGILYEIIKSRHAEGADNRDGDGSWDSGGAEGPDIYFTFFNRVQQGRITRPESVPRSV